MRGTIQVLGLFIALMGVSTNAYAVRIPIDGTDSKAFYILTEDKNKFELLLAGGAVNNDPKNPIVVNDFQVGKEWKINLDVTLENNPRIDGPPVVGAHDRVVISGEVFHMSDPPPDPAIDGKKGGDAFKFEFLVDPLNQRNNVVMVSNPGTVHHGGHSDRYFDLRATQTAGGGVNQLIGWNAAIEGTHRAQPAPEPSTLILVSTGLLGLGIGVLIRWRKT